MLNFQNGVRRARTGPDSVDRPTSKWQRAGRAITAVLLGASAFAVALIASPASAATNTNTLVFYGGAAGSNGVYTLSVAYGTTSPTYAVVVGDTADATATITLAVTAGTAGCTISASVVTYQSAGSCVITASDSGSDKDNGQGVGDGNSSGQSATLTLTVLATQTITFTNAAPNSPTVGSTYTVTATGGASGNPVTFSVDTNSTTSGCTVVAGVVTLTAPAGTCTIDANQVGSAAYAAAAQVQQTVTSALATQTITVTNPNPDTVVLGSVSTYQIHATSSGGGTLTYAASSTSCTVNAAGTISSLSIGNCVIMIDATANAAFDTAPVVQFTLDVLSPPVPVIVSSSPPPVVVPPVVPPVVTPVSPPPPIVIPVSPPKAPHQPKPKPKPIHKPKPTHEKHVPKAPHPEHRTRTVVIRPFSPGSWTLSKSLKAQVWGLAELVKHQHYRSVTLEGFTDNVFTPALDAVLVQSRAEAVDVQLAADFAALKIHGVKVIVVQGVAIQLVSLNTTAKSRALNRRVIATLRAH